MTLQRPQAAVADHPLSPLAAEEIEAAAAILREAGRLGPGVRVHGMTLREPDKRAVLAYRPGEAIDREVLVILHDRARGVTAEALVSVSAGEVRDWRERTDVQPPITIRELMDCEETIKADPQWRAAMRRRGVEDFALAMVDPWPTGFNGDADRPERGRTIRGLTWVRHRESDNGYARPVENLVVLFDLDAMRVLDVADYGVVPVPRRSANYTAEALSDPDNVPYVPDGPRADLKALDVVQADGPSFTVDGHQVEWQRWRFRIGFTQREGLVLHLLEFRDGVGGEVAYKLVPGDNVGTFYQPGSPGLERAGFIAHHLWVTAYDPDELHAAGPYPNQHPGGAGLPAYVSADRPLEAADVVLWYTFGAHHVVRPEDWPVMPVTRIGFALRPTGFFAANPALDLPAPAACHPQTG